MKPLRPAAPLLALLVVVLVGCGRDNALTRGTNPTAPSGPLVTLVDVTDSIKVTAGEVGTWNFAGQSLTIPGTGTYGNVRFNWYTASGIATAFGTVFVLDREFLGLPTALGPSTPGYVGQADAIIEGNPGPMDPVKGEYVFPAAMTLQAGRQYWFYANKQGGFACSFDIDIYPGGDLYVTGVNTLPFHKAPAAGRYTTGWVWVPPPAGVFTDANFRLQASAR